MAHQKTIFSHQMEFFSFSKKVLFLFRLLSSRPTKGDTHNNIFKKKKKQFFFILMEDPRRDKFFFGIRI